MACEGCIASADKGGDGSIQLADFTSAANVAKLLDGLKNCYSSAHNGEGSSPAERFSPFVKVTGNSQKNQRFQGWGSWSAILPLALDADGDANGRKLLFLINLVQFFNAVARLLGRAELVILQPQNGKKLKRKYSIADALQKETNKSSNNGQRAAKQSIVAIHVTHLMHQLGLHTTNVAVPIKRFVKIRKDRSVLECKEVAEHRSHHVPFDRVEESSRAFRKAHATARKHDSKEDFEANTCKTNHIASTAAIFYNIEIGFVGVDVGDPSGPMRVEASKMQLAASGTEWHRKPPVAYLAELQEVAAAMSANLALEAIKIDTAIMLKSVKLGPSDRVRLAQDNADSACIPRASLGEAWACMQMLAKVWTLTVNLCIASLATHAMAMTEQILAAQNEPPFLFFRHV